MHTTRLKQLQSPARAWLTQHCAGLKEYQFPATVDVTGFAPGTNELPPVPKVPIFKGEFGEAPRPTSRQTILWRGPELVHTEFLYKQYGLVVLLGGLIKHENFENLRNIVNPLLNDKTFAVWRVEPPWLARSRTKGKKPRVKGDVDHYVTPVKSGRVIFELFGDITLNEARHIIGSASMKIHMPSRCFHWNELQEMQRIKEENIQKNVNQFNWDLLMKWNMQNCASWLSPYDYIWGPEFR